MLEAYLTTGPQDGAPFYWGWHDIFYFVSPYPRIIFSTSAPALTVVPQQWGMSELSSFSKDVL